VKYEPAELLWLSRTLPMLARLHDLHARGNPTDREVKLEMQDLVRSLLESGMDINAIKLALGLPLPQEPAPATAPAPEPPVVEERPWYKRLVDQRGGAHT
jgi:hypothetical protein